MATAKLLLATAASLAVLLALLAAPLPAGASELMVFERERCTGPWQDCTVGKCCVIKYHGSYHFKYWRGWRTFFYNETDSCSGSYNEVPPNEDYPCRNGFFYKSVKILSASGFSQDQELIKLPRAVAAGKK